MRELKPAVAGDVSFDGQVDGADLIEVALRVGGKLATTRRKDGKYDPLYDLNRRARSQNRGSRCPYGLGLPSPDGRGLPRDRCSRFMLAHLDVDRSVADSELDAVVKAAAP